MACNWVMMTSSAEHHLRRFGYSPTDKTKKNKTFNKRKNRALLTVRRSQKHYEIFGNNVLRKNITRKQLRLRDSKLAQCLGCKRFSHSLHSVVA